jgi:flavin reductase (DIM6/NTAB) family NADH-FMN oxidoreductase RutF
MEHRDPSDAPADAMTSTANYPLYVVTAADDDEISGCLAGFVTQSSIEPVRFIICISKSNHTFAVAENSASLALHLLGSDQRAMASLFGETTGDVVDKFAGVAWTRGGNGAPVLADCAAWIEGSVVNRMSAGDHEAFFVTVSDGGPGTHRGCLMLDDAGDFTPGHRA